MNTLLLSLLALAAVCTLFGIVRLFLNAQDFNDKRRFFEHRSAGRQKARRKFDDERPDGWRAIRRF